LQNYNNRTAPLYLDARKHLHVLDSSVQMLLSRPDIQPTVFFEEAMNRLILLFLYLQPSLPDKYCQQLKCKSVELNGLVIMNYLIYALEASNGRAVKFLIDSL